MPISIDSVYTTLNNFFLNQFNVGTAGDRFRLRFGQSRAQITDQDYSTPNKAVESFSHLVNQIPIEKGDGLTIFFSGLNQIDEMYFYQLLTPATCLNPRNAPALGRLKDEAKTIWENIKLQSGSGLQEQFRPSVADPVDWYNKNNDTFWTNKSFVFRDPTVPEPNNTFTMSFDYGKVTVRRKWYFEPFINDKSWYIPGKYEGQLTSYNKENTNLTGMPIGFIAIKNLRIQGNFLADELAGFETQFGPFLVSPGDASNLEHDGVQIIGWILEKMPVLPPLKDDSLPAPNYSLTENAISANWASFLNPPGTTSPVFNPFVWKQPSFNVNGSADIDKDVRLEDGRIYTALRTFTMLGAWGSIRGYYPPVTLNWKGNFSAKIGFAYNSPPQLSSRILFQVLVFTPGKPMQPPKVIVNEYKSLTRSLIRVQADLSSFQNEEIAICLFVGNSSYYSGASAYWVNPIIK